MKSPLLVVTETKSMCMHNLTGIETPLVAKMYSDEWYNGSITANSVVYDHYDDHCEKSIRSFFLYSVTNKDLDECESIGLNKEMNKDKSIDKSKLKDF